jgi:hypothetical protein
LKLYDSWLVVIIGFLTRSYISGNPLAQTTVITSFKNVSPLATLVVLHINKMAILEDFEVSVVATETGQALEEFDNPKDDPIVNQFLTEKYIQATTGVRFQVQVHVKPSFNLYHADGIGVSINIDGGVVNHMRFYHKERVENSRKKKQPLIDGHVAHKMGSRWVESPFVFGSIDIGKLLHEPHLSVCQ